MEPGHIVEYIDNQKIVCAVVLEVKKQRLRVLTETNREANLAAGRLSFKCTERLNLSASRDKIVAQLKAVAETRKKLMTAVKVDDLWKVLHNEQEWLDLDTMTAFCFDGVPTADQKSAVIRTFFRDRTYFKFDHDRFFPYTEEKVEQIKRQLEEQAHRDRIVKGAADWLKKNLTADAPVITDDDAPFVEILKSYYLFGKESPDYDIGKAILARTPIQSGSHLFKLFAAAGIWAEDEDIELLRSRVPTSFSESAMKAARELAAVTGVPANQGREDLRDLTLITIDGIATLDFDDALSIEKRADGFQVGVHIADVGTHIESGSVLDREAMLRGSSIYMPDNKIPMLPVVLSEHLCSLKIGTERPAISILVRTDREANVFDYRIVPSIVTVRQQLTYSQVDAVIESDEALSSLYALAQAFRERRLAAGAIQLTLPEIVIDVDAAGAIDVKRMDREGAGRMLVAEMMIMANWVMARYLDASGLPAVFRSQPEPKSRLITDGKGTFFQNCMQRKHLSRVVLSSKPEHHTGLGLDAYVTATSPIRKYVDLATQRQIRAGLALNDPYSEEEIKRIILSLEDPLQMVTQLQIKRHRYWLLKFLEQHIGERLEAVVLDKRRDGYVVMLPAFMLECRLPPTSNTGLKPGDLVQVTIQHANARNDILSVF